VEGPGLKLRYRIWEVSQITNRRSAWLEVADLTIVVS
jgi:hypothetical protein